jgi:hypothetical protein
MWTIEIQIIFRKAFAETQWWYTHNISGDYFTEAYPAYKDYIKNHYIATGDAEIVDTIYDDFSMMRTIFYKNQEILDKWANDEIIKEILLYREVYHLQNKIWVDSFKRIDHAE